MLPSSPRESRKSMKKDSNALTRKSIKRDSKALTNQNNEVHEL